MPVMTLAEVLDQCVSEIRAGRATLDECLAAHPDQRSRLEPLLRTAVRLAGPEIHVDPVRSMEARVRFTEALHGERLQGIRNQPRLLNLLPLLLSRSLRAPVALGVIALTAVATGSGATYASQEALPGSPLYGVKTALEQARIALAPNDEARLHVRLDIAARRLDEVDKATVAQNAAAAQVAAESYATAVAAVSEQVTALDTPGKDTGDIAGRLAVSLEQQQAVLERTVVRAPEQAARALNRARAYASRGLERAKDKSGRDDPGKRVTLEVGATALPPGKSGGQTEQPSLAVAAALTAGAPPAPENGQPALAGRDGRADKADRESAAASDLNGGLAEAGSRKREAGSGTAAAGDLNSGLAGLKVKLEAVSAAFAQGQHDAARRQLKAFRDQVEVLRRSGQLSDEDYQTLHVAYQAIERTLAAGSGDANPEKNGSGGRDEQDDKAGKDERGPRAGASPAASAASPETPTQGRGNGDDRGREKSESVEDDRNGKAEKNDSGSRVNTSAAVPAAPPASPKPDRGNGDDRDRPKNENIDDGRKSDDRDRNGNGGAGDGRKGEAEKSNGEPSVRTPPAASAAPPEPPKQDRGNGGDRDRKKENPASEDIRGDRSQGSSQQKDGKDDRDRSDKSKQGRDRNEGRD